ncbi:MAG: PLDc N-terminal domain-containing protein [Candidatus Freyarchaeota archaeon]|nr:PLDc N-terminal domain-containing protein [Candidatus Freyrarchaeum guaymaensis]
MLDVFPAQFFMASLLMVVWMIVVGALIIVDVIIAVWVYRDARDRGMEAELWLIIVLLTGILGLIIYLIVRE